MTTDIFDRLGSLAERLRDRVGREFGSCRTCGKPTRSHRVGNGLQCHACFANGRRVLATDGGAPADGQERGDTRDRIAQYADLHPDAGVIEALGELTLSPAQWRDVVADALEADDPYAAVATTDDCETGDCMVDDGAPEGESPSTNPAHDAGSENANQQPTPEDGGSLVSDSTVSGENAEESAEEGGSLDAAAISEAEESGPSYRELYLEARERSDADRALVPHEDIAPVFDEAGYGNILEALPRSEWTVWTPGNRETPLYAYTPDLTDDAASERERLVELLTEVGVGTERFIDVLDGQKASFDTAEDRPADDPELSGNYGVKGGRGADGGELWLVDIDVDDYDEAKESNDRVEELRGETLGVASAHTTRDRPGHLYVAVRGDPVAVARDYMGREVDNPAASFGEIRVKGQYVVGPGSEIVCGCPRCSDNQTPEHYGRYELATEQPPVVWSEDEFREFLAADPAIQPAEAREDHVGSKDRSGGDSGVFTDDVSGLIEIAKKADSYVADALQDAVNPSDRSQADSAVARAVGPWVGYDEGNLEDVLDNHGTSKWENRGDSYRSSILDYATSRSVDAYDTLPYWALVELAVADDLLDRADLVERDTDDGSYTAFPDAETYNAALDHVREEYGVDPGREHADAGGENSSEEYDDPREIDATVDAHRAWDAAGRVTPDDLDTDRLETTDRSEAFACPECGERVDVVRAVAVDEGLLGSCDDTLDEAYPEAYARARTDHGAPLPEYYTTSDAIAEFDALLDLIGEVTFWHLDTDALDTEITERGDEAGGDAARSLNPAWRESDSETSVLVFDSGTIWDADTERTLDALRFVALDSGLIDDPTDPLEGELFTEAYGLARREYGAPLPRWEPAEDGAREITPQLPASEELVDGCDLEGVDTDALDDAREDVESLIGEAATDSETPTVVTALPATGKTTGTVKTAADRPLSYLAPRKELQQQALDKADRWDVDARVLPVFADERVRDGVLNAAVSHVRENGKDRLRDRWAILGAAFEDLDEEEADTPDLGDIFEEDDEDADTVDLDRPTCETAEGEHGVAWALAVHVARRLGYTPREIHGQAKGLFGAPLPCSCDEDGDEDGVACEYGEGWERVRDADDTPDLLVGSYIHAHVESVRTVYTRGPDGDVETSPRAVVVDEFPGEAFVREFGEEAHDFATWLARCLRDDVEDRRDMFDADLWGDEWVRAWLNGNGDEADAVRDATGALARTGDLLDAREGAVEILEEVDTGLLETLGLADALERVGDADDPGAAFAELADAIGSVDPEHPAAGISRWADEAVREPLDTATAGGSSNPSVDAADTDALPIGADLRALVDDAVEAVEECRDGARAAIDAAVTALRGGREGCRRLAAWADDGYAHPDAHHLLTNIITPTGAESDDPDARRVRTSSWAFDPDATDGTVVDVVETGKKARSVVDRNDHGALLQTPPSRISAGGEDVPLVGLDATGRATLWSNAVGESVDTADIHTTPAERAEFLENALSLRVLQASDRPRSYEGDPTTKDTDGDVALLEAIADEYAGVEAPRQRAGEPVSVGNPAAITTKGVRDLLEADSRLNDVVAEWENYGNLTGANDLGDHQLAAVLGSQHYGDDAIERFCALAGREVDTSRDGGRGGALGYDDDLAEAYLKHMTDDQTMQAVLRFARGDSGATVVARTSALREDLPVVGRAQVVDTWSDTATTIAREYRRLGDEFTAGDVADSVDVSRRQVRRVLAELVEAGYIRHVGGGDGVAKVYEPSSDPGAGEVDLPERSDAVEADTEPGRSSSIQYYTWNVRVRGGEQGSTQQHTPVEVRQRGAPPSPTAVDGVEPPG